MFTRVFIGVVGDGSMGLLQHSNQPIYGVCVCCGARPGNNRSAGRSAANLQQRRAAVE